MHHDPGIGPTSELSLRVSVATLVRVLLLDPAEGELRLALERKATLHPAENGGSVEVKSQPFGGAVRILDPTKLRGLIGSFRFDSEQSRSEQDFRIFIRPLDWERVREFCIHHFNGADDPILESDPGRELNEEFAEALEMSVNPDQYGHRPIATAVEDVPAPTENIHASGFPTARVYRIFEAAIRDVSLAHAVLENSASLSDQDLFELTMKDARNGGKGRANAFLTLPLKRLTDHYLAMPPHERNVPILFGQNRLDETVPAILEGISVPKFQRL
jgi:hypothetical protein